MRLPWEMPRFNKAESELITNEDKWLYVLKNLTDFQNRPDRLKERIFKKFFTLAEISNLKPAELADYETSLKYYRDYYNTLDASEQKGREEGREEERYVLIKKMQNKKMTLDQIADLLDLDLNEIKRIISVHQKE